MIRVAPERIVAFAPGFTIDAIIAVSIEMLFAQ